MYIYISKKSLRQSRHGGTEKKKPPANQSGFNRFRSLLFFRPLASLVDLVTTKKKHVEETYARQAAPPFLSAFWVLRGGLLWRPWQ